MKIWEILILMLAVGTALVYLITKFIAEIKGKSGCSDCQGNCGGCDHGGTGSCRE